MNRECRGGRPLSQLMCGIEQKCRQVYGTTNGGKRKEGGGVWKGFQKPQSKSEREEE